MDKKLVPQSESPHLTRRFAFQEIKKCLFSIHKLGNVNDIFSGAKVCFESEDSLRMGEIEGSGLVADIEQRR
jgi:hypothetical protein